ncbi:response regulator transcription factor [Rhizobacter fulvus]
MRGRESAVRAVAPAIHVVAVDDDGFMRDLLGRVLTGAGMNVTCYGSPAELLGHADLASSDVLLLDVKMPGMSGLDLHDLLVRRGVDLPVVFISGAADLEMAVNCDAQRRRRFHREAVRRLRAGRAHSPRRSPSRRPGAAPGSTA